jgi:hydrogenase maturation protease
MNKELAAVLIVGIGNIYRNDDGVGIRVARELAPHVPPRVEVKEGSGEGTALLEMWKGFRSVFLTDALRSGAPAGTIRRFDLNEKRLPTESMRHSDHAFGVAEAVELARALDELPLRLILYGIEGQNFNAGDRLSPAVEKAIAIVVSQLLRECDG